MNKKFLHLCILTLLMSLPLIGHTEAITKPITLDKTSPLELINLIQNKDTKVAAAPETTPEINAEVKTENPVQQATISESAQQPTQTIPQALTFLDDKPKSENNLPILRTVLSVIFVASLIFILASIVHKKFGQSNGLIARKLPLKINQTLSIGLKRSLLIVEVDNEKYLIGATPQNIQLISKINQDSTIEDIKTTETKMNFAENLHTQDKDMLISKSRNNAANLATVLEQKVTEQPSLEVNIHQNTLSSIDDIKKRLAKLKPLNSNQAFTDSSEKNSYSSQHSSYSPQVHIKQVSPLDQNEQNNTEGKSKLTFTA